MTNTIAEFIRKEIEKLNTSIKTFEDHLESHEQITGLTDEVDRMYAARIKGRIDTLQMMRDMYQLMLIKYGGSEGALK